MVEITCLHLNGEVSSLRDSLVSQSKKVDERKHACWTLYENTLYENTMPMTKGPARPVRTPKLTSLERSTRQELAATLVFRNIPGDVSDLHSYVTNMQPVKESCMGSSMVKVWRGNGSVSHLVFVRFNDSHAKMAVKHLGRLLAGSDISMDHALTHEQVRMRSMQWPLLKQAKEEGRRWCWSDLEPEKLILLGKKW